MKIAILGYSGCGKSTLAKYLSVQYHIPLLYLDIIQFEANWKERNREDALAMVTAFMQQDEWVIDGNYQSFLQEWRLKEADYIIFMPFSRWNCLFRAYRRHRTYKNATRESMVNGCNEKMDMQFIWWILYQGRTQKKKRQFEAILKKYPDKSIVLKNQKELDGFMVNLFDHGCCQAEKSNTPL